MPMSMFDPPHPTFFLSEYGYSYGSAVFRRDIFCKFLDFRAMMTTVFEDYD